ncbi:osmotically inducible protein OsmC [Rarobacter incanus]|uniref:Osmotically inducible protein OsmC n=2 Tax=Rarobacter incanus TaxID=153494 RepID=A0A542SNY9_9MICO|nr:osmotically inducible protein OsmC [Rarobacter incanus]
MVVSKAATKWQGTLFEGSGRVNLVSSGAADLPVDWKARSEGSDKTTTPEELIAAAHSACFAMAFSNALTEFGTPPTSVDVAASVGFKPGVGITGSALTVTASVPGISEQDFQRIAAEAKSGCPVSVALSGIDITLQATLAQD